MRSAVLAVMLLLASCGPADRVDGILDDYAALRDRMCACADRTCVDLVSKDLRAFRAAMRARLGDAKPTTAQEKRGRKVEDALSACRRKLTGTAEDATSEPGLTP